MTAAAAPRAAAPRPAAPRAEKLGNCTCPLCRSNARVSLSKSGMPVITCQACHTQIFARSSHSDLLIRSMLKPPAADPPPDKVDVPPAGDAPPPPKPAPRRPEPGTETAAGNPWNIW